MPVVVDGHNLLWAVQELSDEVVSDVQLCRIVGRYLKLTGENGQIIFDGIGPPDKSGFDNISDVEVFFAGQNTDADTVIEKKITASTAPKRLTVVSTDRRLRRAARARKASAIKSEDFWVAVQKRVRAKSRSREPAEKRLGLTDSETEQWLEFFDLDQ
jgi:hypothetical protein